MNTENRERYREMKKFAVIKNIGKWEIKDGRKIIYGKVERFEFVTDSNDYSELIRGYAFRPTEYADNGEWYSYSVEKKTYAKILLAKSEARA